MNGQHVMFAALAATGFLSIAHPAHASVQARSGLPQGLNLGLGLAGAAIDYAAGPVSAGFAVTGSPTGMGRSYGGLLSPSARVVVTTRNDPTLSFGLVAGASAPLTYPPFAPVPQPVGGGTVQPVVAPEPVRVPIGDVGLAVSYRFALPTWFGAAIPLTLSPTVTFMLDGSGNVTFGPHTSLELAARFSPDVELTLGGGTAVGVRFRI